MRTKLVAVPKPSNEYHIFIDKLNSLVDSHMHEVMYMNKMYQYRYRFYLLSESESEPLNPEIEFGYYYWAYAIEQLHSTQGELPVNTKEYPLTVDFNLPPDKSLQNVEDSYKAALADIKSSYANLKKRNEGFGEIANNSDARNDRFKMLLLEGLTRLIGGEYFDYDFWNTIRQKHESEQSESSHDENTLNLRLELFELKAIPRAPNGHEYDFNYWDKLIPVHTAHKAFVLENEQRRIANGGRLADCGRRSEQDFCEEHGFLAKNNTSLNLELNAYNKVRKYVNAANSLIKSAVNGTFPYFDEEKPVAKIAKKPKKPKATKRKP